MLQLRRFTKELLIIVPVLLSIWLLAAYLSRHNRYSYFFRPEKSRLFEQHELYRRTSQTAWRDLLAYAKEKGITRIFDQKDSEFCVGVLSMARTKALERKYLTSLMTSLVTRIPWKLQNRISIRIFNMNSPLETHREALEMGRLFRVMQPEYPSGVRLPEADTFMYLVGKENLDYLAAMRALQHCKHVLLLEDDALASLNWFAKIEQLLSTIPKNTHWLYLKLFAQYRWMGWGMEVGHIATLVALGVSAALITSLFVGMILCHKYTHTLSSKDEGERPHARATSLLMPRFTTALSIALMIPFFVVLFHCIGRQHLFPLRRGVQAYPLHAGFVAVMYAQAELTKLADYYEQILREQSRSTSPEYLPKDNVPNQYRVRNNLVELITVPSVFQHTGVHSSLAFKGVHSAQSISVSTDFPDDDEPIRFDRDFVEK